MSRSSVAESSAPPPSAAEWVVGALAFLAVSATTWGFAGRADWAPPVFTALCAAALVAAVALSIREGLRIRPLVFAPLGLFGLLIAASLLNPSHVPVPGYPGAWTPRPEYIPWLPTTVDLSAPLEHMLPWLSALMLGTALRQAAPGRRAVRILWFALLAQGLLVALTGAYFYFADNSRVLGLVTARHGYHFASFLYRNHWAAYVIVLVPVALGFAFSALYRWKNERGKLDAVLGGLGVALLLTLTLPMPGSRSGVVVCGGMLLFALGWLVKTVWKSSGRTAPPAARRWGALGIVAFTLLVLGTGAALNWADIQKHWHRTRMQARVMADGGQELRVHLTRDTLRMAADRPAWGWGLGSYVIVFGRYKGDYLRDAKGESTAVVVHAHNDWAQVAAETGAGGLLILGIPVLVLIIRCRRGESALLRWGGAGTVVLLVYALADFPLHCPAVLLLWTTILCTSAPHVAVPAAKKPRRLSQVSGAKMAARVGVEPTTK